MNETTLTGLKPESSSHGFDEDDVIVIEKKYKDILDKLEIGTVDATELESLFSVSSKNLGCDIVLRFLGLLPIVCKWSEEGLKVIFFKLLKTVFLGSEDLNVIMESYFKLYIEDFGRVPNWKASYELYGSEMTNALNRLGGHTQFQGNEHAFLELSSSFAWLFLLAPKPTMWSLLNHCFESKQVVPSVLKILRRMTAAAKIQLNVDGFDVVDNNKPLISLFLCAIRRMLTEKKFKFSSMILKDGSIVDSDWDRYIYFVVASSRNKYKVKISTEDSNAKTQELGEEVLEKSLISGTEVLKGIVLPQIFARRIIAPMLEIMLRTVSNFQGCRRSTISWITHFSDDSKCYQEISAPFLLRLLLDIYSENLKGDETIRNLCLKILMTLGQRFDAEKIVFDQDSATGLLNYLNRYDWALKYSVVTWFSNCLGDPKRQIPTSLYKALPEKQRHNYKQILVDFDYVLSDCLFQSFYELAGVAPQLAIELIQKGFEVKPAGKDLFVKMSFEFLIAASQKEYESFEKFASLFDAMKCFLKSFDYPVMPFMPLPITESAVYGLRLIEPLVILGNAVIIGINFNNDENKWILNEKQLVHVSSETIGKILEHYCCLTKDHIEKELQDLRRSRLKYVPHIKDPLDVFDGVKINRLNRVFTQVAELFFLTSMIAGQFVKLPSCLKILLLKMSQYQKEVMDLMIIPTIDDLDNEAVRNNVFYAYANGGEESLSLRCSRSAAQEDGCHKKTRELTSSEKRFNALCEMDPSLFQPVYSASIEDFEPADYFTKIARSVPDSVVQETMLKNMSTPKGTSVLFEQAVSGIRKQFGVASESLN